ncbi:MAG: hypothetical protein A3F84_02620 [Candidatus Handelsmanbacteria bacterium RIFCSPLOWO2_12_FULL_64_10]|uniref:ASPIC/UnbV domain-containing protein n=1 Tax=Handelsmanbacteria sp. (strain RIFCSPLOWO2_12_FULL_64_10) TaxID=1817868 RepID=A0A1F6CLZ5_HANXR|nr:MAG: hypothetical protein A3F84_02620 [Candidatus Handelsmanbacteria bacterium RIFCSPLOWO2_12_FULL_64_10]
MLLTGVAFGQGPQFVDVTRQVGVDFRYANGASGRKYAVEPFGAGLALFDYDGDGDLDVYFVNGGPLPGYGGEAIRPGALYRNEGKGERTSPSPVAGDRRLMPPPSPRAEREGDRGWVRSPSALFTDVTAQAGLTTPGYGMGCCVGDYDNDGHPDLYVTNFGADVLYRNNGDGTFADVTRQAGVAGGLWNTGCAFADVDGDGDLDLFVAGYVRFRFDDPRLTSGFYLIPYLPPSLRNKSLGELKVYPDPVNFDPLPDILYRNEGPGPDGVHRFADVTRQAGIVDDGGRSLGVVFLDYDDDGDQDLYVANDETRNTLYRNDRGKFSDVTLFSGVGYDENGRPQASMGVDAGDYDGDGRLDLITTNFQGEHTTLYHNDGGGFFSDVSFRAGVGAVTRPYVGWGVAFFDFDNDGDLDLLHVNGHLQSEIERIDPSTSHAQPTLLLRNDGGTFTDVAATSGLRSRWVGRGAAVGDYDEDGDLDVFIQTLDRTAVVLRNDGSTGLTTGGGNRNHWLRVKLEGGRRPHPPPFPPSLPSDSFRRRSLPREREGASRALSTGLGEGEVRLSNRSAIGARVRVTSGGLTQVREVKSGTSYLSQGDLRLHFGLGQNRRADLVEVRWPSGAVRRLRDVAADQTVTLQEEAEK